MKAETKISFSVFDKSLLLAVLTIINISTAKKASSIIMPTGINTTPSGLLTGPLVKLNARSKQVGVNKAEISPYIAPESIKIYFF